MNMPAHPLNELIEITRDGQRFYEHAREQVQDPHLKALFADLARAKTEVIQALSLRVAASQAQPAHGGTLLGRLHQVYADTKATLSRDTGAAYVAELDACEERLLQAFEDAMQEADPDLRAVLAVELPKVRACHDRMRLFKRAQA